MDFITDIYANVRIYAQNILRILKWIPIIWNDRDWDYAHLFKIISFKLECMENDEGYVRFLYRGVRYKRQLKYAKHLVDKIIDFDINDCTKIEEKYGEISMSFLETDDSNLKECKITRSKLTKENEEQYYLDLKENYLNVELEYSKLVDRCFKHIKKYHQKWWN